MIGQFRSVRPILFSALAAAFFSWLIVFLRVKLGQLDLTAPLSYWGDGLCFEVLVKALTQSGWNSYVPGLDAPFGMAAADFPIVCTLDFGVIKLISFLYP